MLLLDTLSFLKLLFTFVRDYCSLTGYWRDAFIIIKGCVRHLQCVCTVLSALPILVQKSPLQSFEVGPTHYHHFTEEETKMWEGWVICPRFQALTSVGLPCGGWLYSSEPNVSLNYSHFPFCQPGLVFLLLLAFWQLTKLPGFFKSEGSCAVLV